MNNIFQLLLVSAIVVLTLLMTIVFVQVLLVIHDFKKLIKKMESTTELSRVKDGLTAAVKVKQFFHSK
jgi:CHASE3 domain sensor protein